MVTVFVSVGSHNVHSMRDMRDAMGALGPVDDIRPELSNLTCSMTIVENDDIVFLTTDGKHLFLSVMQYSIV